MEVNTQCLHPKQKTRKNEVNNMAWGKWTKDGKDHVKEKTVRTSEGKEHHTLRSKGATVKITATSSSNGKTTGEVLPTQLDRKRNGDNPNHIGINTK